MKIRSAQEADIAEIARIFRIIRNNDLPYLPVLHSPEEDQEYFGNKVFKDEKNFVAEEEGKIVGFCAFREGWVDHLYILPDYQRKGFGRLLLNKAKEVNSELQLWAFQKNTRAIEFYEKNGFKIIKKTDGQGNEEKEPDVLFFWKNKAGQ